MLLQCNLTGLVSCSDILGTHVRLGFVRLRVAARIRANLAGLVVVSNNVLLVVTDNMLKGVANYIYIPIWRAFQSNKGSSIKNAAE